MSERIIIIGGGVIGLTLAWRLLKDGAGVAVIDAGPAIPAATSAAAGMLAPSFETAAGPVAGALYDFSVASLKRWRDFAEELEGESGEKIDYRPFGILGVAADAQGAARLRESYDEALARGAPVEWLSGDAARALEPGLSLHIIAALFAREDGQVDPRLATKALRKVAARLGGVFIEDKARRIATQNGAVAGVETARGDRFDASQVVVAAGAAAGAIDIAAAKPPVFPIKGEAVALSAGEKNPRLVVRAPGAYLCPKADGRLVIGATEVEGDASLAPSAAAIGGLKHAGAAAFPASADFAETERWAGLRPATPDAAPILGTVPGGPDGLFLALGHYRNGVLLAPETAAALGPLILRGEAVPAMAAFSVNRFDRR